jgi:hypothetical protein
MGYNKIPNFYIDAQYYLLNDETRNKSFFVFVDIIICVLFVGRGQSISCDNYLSNPISLSSPIKITTCYIIQMIKLDTAILVMLT